MNHLSQNQNAQPIAQPLPFTLPPSIKRSVEKPKEEIRYTVGIYLRLSRDDGRYKMTSASIETQRDIVSDYVSRCGLAVYDIYVDDGWSGTNFDRPDWKRLMTDIETGNVNMIAAKDMSRIGRESAEVGTFIEKYCTEQKIRLVAVSDGIDTLDNGHEEILDIINMYNGWYPKDISKKTRWAKYNKASQGWFIGSYPPFGYIKDPEDKHKLLLSEDAPIVREIFERAANGETLRQICDDFNARGVITPSVRINTSGGKHVQRVTERAVWNTSTMNAMMNNLVYLGHMVQGKRQNVGHKGKIRRMTDFEEQFKVYNTHEAAVSEDLWDAAQKSRKGRNGARKTNRTQELNLFAGHVYCAECGGVLAATKKQNKSDSYDLLRCARYNNGGKHACSSHTIRFDALYKLTLTDITRHIALAQEDEQAFSDNLYRHLLHESQAEIKARESMIAAAEGKVGSIQKKLEMLYEEKWERQMPDEVFKPMLSRYTAEKEAAEKALSQLKADSANVHDTEANIEAWMEEIRQSVGMTQLDRALLGRLVDRIVVHERETVNGETTQRVEIYYKFVGKLSPADSAA